MTRAPWRGHAVRWLVAIAMGAAVFEALDTLAIQIPLVAWLTLISPMLAGGATAWLGGGGSRSRLLAAAAVAWVRIGADRAIGLSHGVRQPLEVELAVGALFGIPWMALAVLGGVIVVLARPRPRAQESAPKLR